MRYDNYFYNCSEPYLNTISPTLFPELIGAVEVLPKRETQAEINKDLFWLLTSKGWSFDSLPSGLKHPAPLELGIDAKPIGEIKNLNRRNLCTTSTTLGANWKADFAKQYDGRLVQIEAQFGKVESMFKDFCGFKIGQYEKRLALGIEVVMYEPGSYFAHRKNATSGMAYFDIAKKTLPAIGLDCPIWLLGIKV